MTSKTTFFILVSVYVISVIANSLKNNGTIGHTAVPYILHGILFLAYTSLSIVLTLKLNKEGAFQWISDHPTIRNCALFLGLLAIIYAAFSAAMVKLDWSTYQYDSTLNPKNFMAYTAYIWVPLLTIIPFALWIFSKDFSTSSGLTFKFLVLFNVFIGASLYLYFNFGFLKSLTSPQKSEQDYFVQQTIEKIQSQSEVIKILYYTRPLNEKSVVDAAWVKIKSIPNWETQLTNQLENCNHNSEFNEIYDFLSTYRLDNPAPFVTPFLNSMECLSKQIQKIANNPYTRPNDLDALRIKAMLQAIEMQFLDFGNQVDAQLSRLSVDLKRITREDFIDKIQDLINAIEANRNKLK